MSDEAPKVSPIIPPANDSAPDTSKIKKEKEEKPPVERTEAPKGTGRKGPGTTSTVSGRPTKLHRELAEFMSLGALAFEIKGDYYCAYVWNSRVTAHAYAWGDLAEKNPALKRKLLAMMEGGAYGAVIFSGLALLVPILAYYGLYPQSMFNPFALSPQEQAEYEASQGRNGNHPGGLSMWQNEDEEGAIPHPLD